MFRIISGKWKAKRISAPKNFEVRPTTDFAKEALFSIIENRYDVEDCAVLDLFAGIGSITMEFASRYCNDVTAVEVNQKHCAFISQTASDLELSMPINVQRADVYDWLKKNRRKKSYDIIFADPPFLLEDKKYDEIVNLIIENNFLNANGSLIIEHQTRRKINHIWVTETRKYGNISFSILVKPEDVPTDSSAPV